MENIRYEIKEKRQPQQRKPELIGGKMAVKDIQALLKHSYDKMPSSQGDYELDPSLSDNRAQVYKKKGSNQVIVVHRGTQGLSDWGVDLRYALGMDINKTSRLQHAKDIQQKAEAKYGRENITTLGHSLGSKIAKKVGKNSHEIINLNPAVNIKDSIKASPANEFDIRSANDIVSSLINPNQYAITIPSQSWNPFEAHKTDILNALPPDQQIGRGHVAKMPMKHLKDVAKKMSGTKFKLTGKKKAEIVDHICRCCKIA